MIVLKPPIRRARAGDAAALADLVDFAGEGMPSYLWRQMAVDGGDPWEIGRRRQANKAAEGQIFVIDEGEGAIASLTGYAIAHDPEPIPDDLPAMFRPLQELENLAPATWYVNVLATMPEHRGRGLGMRLLALAEDLAREQGLSAMSLIVASGNAGARRLYERIGYGETARRAIVKDGWDCDSDEWVLLVKRLRAAAPPSPPTPLPQGEGGASGGGCGSPTPSGRGVRGEARGIGRAFRRMDGLASVSGANRPPYPAQERRRKIARRPRLAPALRSNLGGRQNKHP